MSAPEEGALVSKLHGMGYIPIKISPSSAGQKLSLSMRFSAVSAAVQLGFGRGPAGLYPGAFHADKGRAAP